MKNNLYEKDFYDWTMEQARLLKNNNLNKLDLANLIEEIESLGRNDLRSLKSQVIRLLHHLLKWSLQPERRGASWQLSILNSRNEIKDLINDSPSLKNKIIKSYNESYIYAVKQIKVVMKDDKIVLPDKCPWDFNKIMDENFWPEEVKSDRNH